MGRSRTTTKTVLWTAVSLVAVLVIAAAVTLIALKLDDSDTVALPPGVPSTVPQVTPSPRVTPVAATAPEPTADGVRAALAKPAAATALGRLTGQVTDAVTGNVLWSSDPARPMVPASTTKLLTASASMLGMPADHRLTTTVVRGTGNEVILVGAGDPTLSAQPLGAPTLFTDAPRIADLAKQIRAAGIDPTSVSVDTSQFTGPSMAKTWETDDIAGGSIAPVQSLMADSGRLDPLALYSPRTDTPATAAGRALAADLGLPTDTVREATAPAGAQVVASVRSAPLSTRLVDMMNLSDDVLAETLGIELSRAQGGTASLDGAVQAVHKTLADNGQSVAGVSLKDTNGLSVDDRLTAQLLDGLLTAAAGNTTPRLRPLLDTLPVAGATGTLSDRFTTGGADSGAGWVRAKTGTLTGVSTLAGIVQTRDARVLTFALMSNGTSPDQARPALDTVATALRECGCR
ncbi:D-alanyl-D-alanine carboxypeptidase/D-alanyl-D-alanine endopeptidase [Williamsia sterculiae]|uniref:D-alanyl-D-alanine carboxypeptidase / D-alanyl-D-alanine-endopeptidase (Penicillin-binding protein 4) n=1 Tax=Williamsia sterculiae TaxID=1344003 RepID=A0A1N7CR09_9NOCA|nr:D-alanyl-D-alanine carboxypeptidase/D-alanyl-D-alanine-endopeptidase [Williamsia sterculiae]SIR66033.1 D-alanyl-D-alanine carboxypeptidase / D-alanyl-D-alanine-endopeptidase (penicillin-binding protein 4) [Williamsia sterculiae]